MAIIDSLTSPRCYFGWFDVLLGVRLVAFVAILSVIAIPSCWYLNKAPIAAAQSAMYFLSFIGGILAFVGLKYGNAKMLLPLVVSMGINSAWCFGWLIPAVVITFNELQPAFYKAVAASTFAGIFIVAFACSCFWLFSVALSAYIVFDGMSTEERGQQDVKTLAHKNAEHHADLWTSSESESEPEPES